MCNKLLPLSHSLSFKMLFHTTLSYRVLSLPLLSSISSFISTVSPSILCYLPGHPYYVICGLLYFKYITLLLPFLFLILAFIHSHFTPLILKYPSTLSYSNFFFHPYPLSLYTVNLMNHYFITLPGTPTPVTFSRFFTSLLFFTDSLPTSQ